MDVINKTPRSVIVPLPGGKRLFLGAGKTGQVSPKALEHPPLAKLIEAGEIEVVGEGRHRRPGAGGGTGPFPGRGGGPRGVRRQHGDR